MALNLASPGIVVKEVDLTIGRTTPSSDKVGAMVAPFAKGPINLPTLIENENGLLNSFGKPYATDKHYEHWLTASSFLAYGGQLRIIRSDDSSLRNGFVGTASSVKINSLDHYNSLGYDENVLSGAVVAARNPGTWGNALRVAIIDSLADQVLAGVTTGVGVTSIAVGMGVTQAISSILPGSGSTTVLDGYLKGIITHVDGTNVSVKVLSHVSGADVETAVDYQESGVYAFSNSGMISVHALDTSTAMGTTTYTSQTDWFNTQTIGVTSTTTVNWHNIAGKPGTSAYGAARNSRFDEVHVVVIDADGSVSGNAGTILEKHLGLSKAKDAEFSVGSPSYWRSYLAGNSTNIFGLGAPAGLTTTGLGVGTFARVSGGGWDQDAENVIFAAHGSNTHELVGGLNYGGATDLTSTSALTAGLSDLSSGYDLFEAADFPLDFMLMGSAAHGKENAQALANKLISVAELRKDTIAFISPYRGAAITDTSVQSEVNVRSAADITANVLSFYSAVSSSSYAVFDSGYKYMYDRFSNTFRYVPLNGDIAGLCARTDINSFPWFSPAGTARGGILNAVKLAYNPTKSQRDQLYSARINPVMFSPGAGIVLFGDKTGLAKGSAFDRINVRRLFIHLENAISGAAKDQMFEFNDELTRSNFVNTVEPFLRDVQSNRGISDYVVICDETNNTAAVIDNNEFVADIFIKPARSINFVGLTFVATRTGVDFEEVIGNV
jgi:hypothetical protein